MRCADIGARALTLTDSMAGGRLALERAAGGGSSSRGRVAGPCSCTPLHHLGRPLHAPSGRNYRGFVVKLRPKTTEVLFLSIAIVSAVVVIAMATLIALGMGNWFIVVGSGGTMVTRLRG
jgi:hypothetical protein